MRRSRALVLAAALFAAPTMAWANIGVPMIAVTLPLMIVSLVPVIAIEAAVFYRLFNLPFKSCLWMSSLVNFLTMIIGVPITWFVLMIAQMTTGGGGIPYDFNTLLGKFLSVTWQAPWLIPFETNLYWMVPTAMLVLFVPFFLMSWKIETACITQMEKIRMAGIPPESVRDTCFKANAVTYGLMALVVIGLGIIDWLFFQ